MLRVLWIVLSGNFSNHAWRPDTFAGRGVSLRVQQRGHCVTFDVHQKRRNTLGAESEVLPASTTARTQGTYPCLWVASHWQQGTRTRTRHRLM